MADMLAGEVCGNTRFSLSRRKEEGEEEEGGGKGKGRGNEGVDEGPWDA